MTFAFKLKVSTEFSKLKLWICNSKEALLILVWLCVLAVQRAPGEKENQLIIQIYESQITLETFEHKSECLVFI